MPHLQKQRTVRITIEEKANKQITNFPDVKFNLTKNTYQPYPTPRYYPSTARVTTHQS